MDNINKSRIRKWIKALKNGDYEQCTGILYYGDKRCVLGVACEVYCDWVKGGAEGFLGHGLFRDANGEVTKTHGKLPVSVREWFGILDEFMFELIKFNDVYIYTFETLAKIIHDTYLRK